MISFFTNAQQKFILDDFIKRSVNSIENKKVKKNKEIIQNENSLFKKSFLPNVSLNFALPSYNRSISDVLQPDGTFAFRESNSANSRVSLSLSQKLPFTGGEISISNSFNRLDIFGDTQNSTSYSASWFGASLSQPLNFFNEMKWDKKIQETNLEYSEIVYKKSLVGIKKESINHFFELLKIKNEKKILNYEVSKALEYKKIIISLINAGKNMAYDSIDIELKLLNKKKIFKFLEKSEKMKLKSINTFFNSKLINIKDSLQLPIIEFEIKYLQFYIDKYLNIYPIIEKNRLWGLEKNIVKLKKNQFYSANLSVGVGFNNSTDNFDNIFLSPNQSQNFSISLNVPLLDFGRKRLELTNAKFKYEIELLNLDQEKLLSIERISFLYEEINDLFTSLKIEESRIELLKLKFKRVESLLYAQRVLLKDFSDIENLLYDSLTEKLDLIHSIYKKALEIEEITLFNIVDNEN